MRRLLRSVYKIDPLQDPRWRELLRKHRGASVFHSVEWLQALRNTYRYDPVAYTTSPPNSELTNGILFCRIRSWLTGQRLVSLPFSDHCDPLCNSEEETEFLARYLQSALDHQDWKYLELRPFNGDFSRAGEAVGFHPIQTYLLHRLDLRPRVEQLFSTFDKNSVQRRIRRAERAGLVEKCGRSETLLADFFKLLLLTRRRHRLPPQPYVWFQNLAQSFGDAFEIRTTYKDGTATASILTLRFKDTVYYKHGCSDPKFNNLGGMPFLLWKAIAEAKSTGSTEFDLGRTELDNGGLIAFKNNWVQTPQSLVYWKFPSSSAEIAQNERKLMAVKRVFSIMPDRLLLMAGKMIYPHIG